MNKIPQGVIEVRKELCHKCESKCEKFLLQKISHNDPCESCSKTPKAWNVYGKCELFGLGDAVAMVAQPIAKAIDAVAGTNIQGCGGCKKRQEALNNLVPNL